MIPITEDIKERLRETLEAGIGDEAMKTIKKRVDDICCEIEGDVEYRLKDALAPMLVGFVVDMANKTINAILEGNEDAMRRYIGCERNAWTGRSDSSYWVKGDPKDWHPVIHGTLFEQGVVKLRRDIVNAHRDLLVNERIKDLEDQNVSLVAQVNKAIAEKNGMYERVRSLS